MTWSRRHAHDYQPAAVQSNGGLFAAATATTILRRCSCGDVTSVTIAGRWTLAQVRGEPEIAAAETGESQA